MLSIEDRSTRITSFTAPNNWERVLGHRSLARCAAFYLLQPNQLLWTDGHHEGISRASRMFKTFLRVEHDNVVGALNALYVYTSFPFGGKDNASATHCILVDTIEHAAWVSSIVDATFFLRQFPQTNIIEFSKPPRGVLTCPCNCTFGWKQDPITMGFTICEQCKGSEVISLQEDF